ncbi:MAG: helix-turn-helix domain-containing protein [Clostridia bacterium]|nr:helix-turn-helix domain-containing protein [Clostridia bacterium]
MRIRKDIDELREQDILLIAKISDALAHPARIKIFRYVMHQNRERKPVCNKDLVKEFGYAQATISQHVSKLVQAELLQVQKKDRFSYYFVHLGTLQNYLDATRKFG